MTQGPALKGCTHIWRGHRVSENDHDPNPGGEGSDSARDIPRCPTSSRSCWQKAPSFNTVLQKVLAVSPADMQGPRPRAGGTARPLSTISAYPVKLCSSSSSLSRQENTAWSGGSWE